MNSPRLPQALIHPDLRQAQDLQAQAQQSAIPSGHAALDAQLPGGGWPTGCLTELLVRGLGAGELRLLAPALRRLAQSGKKILMLAPPQMPYGPALSALGLPPESFIVIRASQAADRLWAIEQTLRAQGFGALLAWAPQQTTAQQVRRFQLAARLAQGPVFLFRPLSEQHQPSAAPLRLALLPRAYPGLGVQLLKRRGPVQLDPILVNLPIPGRAMQSVSLANQLDQRPEPCSGSPADSQIPAPLIIPHQARRPTQIT
ncbi:MAG: hypothetical protein RL483_179 [Pseudomonadota bacterium]|jgi:protein ImuA